MNLKTAVGERRIRQAEGREDVARKAVAPKRVNCEAVGFRYRSVENQLRAGSGATGVSATAKPSLRSARTIFCARRFFAAGLVS